MFWRVFDAIRRITIFILGTLVIIEALYNEDVPIKSIILGMIMIGILPLEDLLPWSRKRREEEEEIRRLRKLREENESRPSRSADSV